MKRQHSMTPQERARISATTKAAMANSAVRAKIRAGMVAATAGENIELAALQVAWRAARPFARKRFLVQLFAPSCLFPTSQSE
jgi:hypothetical protein